MLDKLNVPYKLVDIGANLLEPSFDRDFDDVLSRAKKAGLVKLMITSGTETDGQKLQKVVSKYPGLLYCTAGVHPHEANSFNDSTIETFRELFKNPQCVAVGECGLDFRAALSDNRSKNLDHLPSKEVQLNAFEKQVALACELQKPLFIHERSAHAEMVEVFGKYKETLSPAVIHCFTGTAKEAQKYIEIGLYIGITGYLARDDSPDGLKYALQSGIIPLDRLLLETDAPFMWPRINTKKLPAEIKRKFSKEATMLNTYCSTVRNEPCSLAITCELLAAYLRKEPQEISEATTANAKLIFGLEL
ncbi:hypothetical protein L596_024577 [Steinernema carpocapsae]|uniref:Deoxyribonuclease TATDN1 n=1 Tax=Steinernema carpocapsae TaxID=34508 RepID=A0A4U5MH64_STECR|nr:hypothetical protein L596_024577 [Steinernema carpocapsae]